MSGCAVNPAEHQPKDLSLAKVSERMAKYQPRVEELWRRYPVKRGALLQALWMVQEEFGWVPREGIKWAADTCAVSHAHAFGVTEFYTMYRQVPAGKHLIQVCQTMCCFIQGSENLIEHLEKSLGIHCGETTSDGLFTLVRVECLALCGSGPGVMIDDQAIGPKPHALGQGKLPEEHLSVPDFHPTPAIVDAWIAFLRAEQQRNPTAKIDQAKERNWPKPITPDATGRFVLHTKGHPGATGASGQVLPPDYCPPAPALKLAAQVAGEKVTLTWINDPGTTKVVVEKSSDNGASWKECATPTPKDQKTVDTLAVGVTAQYRVITQEKDRVARPSAAVSATGQPPVAETAKV
jgi:NADH:ubiquinone oxidoreductase subunit E